MSDYANQADNHYLRTIERVKVLLSADEIDEDEIAAGPLHTEFYGEGEFDDSSDS